MTIRRQLLIFAIAAFLFLMLSSSIFASTAYEANSIHANQGAQGKLTSLIAASPLLTKIKCDDCWAGYGVYDKSGGLTKISSNLVMPATACSSQFAASAFLVVLNNAKKNDFAYAGIEVLCDRGTPTFYAIYYDSNASSGGSASWPLKAGDRIFMQIVLSNHYFEMTVADRTSGLSLIGFGPQTGVARESIAACVTDMTGNGRGGSLPAVNFGTVKFSGCKAKLNGKTAGVGSFDSHLVEEICYNSDGKKVLATPSKLIDDTDFTVKFIASGP